jgi:phosphoglycolate phosphatase-like HAD superfamily hydrolase
MVLSAAAAGAAAGVTTLGDVQAADPSAAPDYVLDSVASLAGL